MKPLNLIFPGPKTSTLKTSKTEVSSKPKHCVSSSSKIKAKSPLFESKALETRYTEKRQEKLVVNGKTIDLEGLKNGGFNVEEIFYQLGWASFLKIDEPQYPKLVKAFYVAANVSKGDILLSIILKGVHIELTPNTMCLILNI